MSNLANGDIERYGSLGATRSTRQRTRLQDKAVWGEGEHARTTTLTNWDAWTLLKLSEAGSRGFAASDAPPGSRVSHFIWRLRHKHGLTINCPREANSGVFGGTHGRYRLVTPVRIVEVSDPRQVGE
jgi:hypothetical protein